MSDFSNICPVFKAGMYSELTFPYIDLASRSTTNNFGGNFAFGRSVIVTAAYVRKQSTFAGTCTAMKLKIGKAASWAATLSVFASVTLSATITTQAVGKYLGFTTTAKTFGATDVLRFQSGKSEAGAKIVDVMVRFKEK